MAVLDRVRSSLAPTTDLTSPPEKVEKRIKRGRARMMQGAAKRNECLRFVRGDQYVFVNSENYLAKQATVTDPDGSGKPRHRVRTTRNLLLDVVAHEVSAATQRVPSYDISPSSTNPTRRAAAEFAAKVALFLYENCDVRLTSEEVVTYAVTTGEGFAWPYFDNSIGPFIKGQDGTVVGLGDIRLRVFGPNEVYWEPGIRFELSRWHAVEQARTIEEVEALDGYRGGKLKPDAQSSDIATDRTKAGSNLVLVTDYLERPTAENPMGSWRVLANKKEIVDPRPYPCKDGEGNPVDEPVLHKLAYFIDPDSDRDMGVIQHCLDAQRTINDCTNRELEWKNLALQRQVYALPGVLKGNRLTDEPGAIFTVQSLEGIRDRDVPPVPGDLREIKEEARADIGRIAAQNDIPAQVQAGKAMAVYTERDAGRRQPFIARLAGWHSRLMRHMLYLVQRHYTEDRLLKIRGPFGPEVHNFTGADLQSECDIRVLPGSIEPLTKEGIEQDIAQVSQLFPGAFGPEKVLSAIAGRDLDMLNQGYDVQVDKQQREIQQMLALANTLNPQASQDAFAQADIPQVVPWDNDALHLDILHSFMETEEFDNLPDEVKHVFETHEEAHRQQQADKAAQAAEAQAQQAQQLGMQNAAKPQGPPPMAPGAPPPR